MSTDYRHLPWEKVAGLSAQLSALPIFERTSPGSRAGEVLTRFLEPAKMNHTAPQTVSAELLERLTNAQRHVASLDHADRTALRRPMVALRTAVQSIDCVACAGASGHPCIGADETKDDDRLTHPGLCIRLLHQLFDDVQVRYGEMIDRLAYDGDMQYRADLTNIFSTRAQAEYAYDRAGPEWKICGYTRFADAAKGRTSVIKLSIAIDVLDWPSLCAAFWVLVHEFVCHAHQGRPNPRPRTACDPSCSFFEGWMDEIANRLLMADVGLKMFARSKSLMVKDHAAELLQAGQDFRSDRYGLRPAATRHKFSRQWDLGVKAVAVVDCFMQSFDPDSERATPQRRLAPIVRLSFRLVARAPTAEEASQIVSALLAAPEVARREGPKIEARLYRLLSGPIGNLSIWINELMSIIELSDM